MYRRLGCFYELPFWVWELVPQVLGGFVQVYFTTTISSGSDSKKNSVPCKSVQIWQDWLWGEVWMLTKKIYIYIYNIGSLSLSLLLTHTDTRSVIRPCASSCQRCVCRGHKVSSGSQVSQPPRLQSHIHITMATAVMYCPVATSACAYGLQFQQLSTRSS